jgi:hypothetical protein
MLNKPMLHLVQFVQKGAVFSLTFGMRKYFFGVLFHQIKPPMVKLEYFHLFQKETKILSMKLTLHYWLEVLVWVCEKDLNN